MPSETDFRSPRASSKARAATSSKTGWTASADVAVVFERQEARIAEFEAEIARLRAEG